MVCLLLLLAQAPLPPDATLPPGHPPIPSSAPGPPQAGAALPPNHPQMTGGGGEKGAPAPSMDELIRRLDAQPDLATREKTFELAESIGRLYFGRGRYRDAVLYLGQALQRAEPARVWYLAKKKSVGAAPVPAPESVGCAPRPNGTLADLFAKAQEKGRPAPAALACARAALEGVMELENTLGHAKFLQKDYGGALAAYSRSLETFEPNPEARYSRGALLLDTRGDEVKMLKLAQADFERFLVDAGTSTRGPQARRFLDRAKAGIAAGGVSKLALARAPARETAATAGAAPAEAPQIPQPAQGGSEGPFVAPQVLEALQNVKVTPEMEAQFAKTLEEADGLLATGRFQEALNAYKQVMPYKPEPRVQAGVAWSLVRLGKPTADRVWMVATQAPDEVAALGDRLKAKGDEAGAKMLWKRLAESVPAYAPRLQGRL